ncbi:MAG: YfhO family protein [Clostridium sp.]
MKRKDLTNVVILNLFILIMMLGCIWYLHLQGKIYGSEVDWFSQHVTLADTFRMKFFNSGQIYPDFFWNLGAGQNMAEFIYYGLLRPEIIVSYLFPMISTMDYIIVSSIVLFMLGTILFYYWIRLQGYSEGIGFYCSILFVLAGPLMFHTHRHLMFVTYFPWYMLMLIGTYQFIQKRKFLILLIGIVLTISSSYYYSVGAISLNALYGLYLILKKGLHEEGNLLLFGKLIGIYVLGIGLSSFLLVPVVYMMKQHRAVLETPSILELFIPILDGSTLSYTSKESFAYTIGLTGISLLAIIFHIYKGKLADRLFSIMILIILIFPIFCFVLNGGQYIRAKSLIPMIPLIILIIASWIKQENVISYHHKILYGLSLVPVLFIQSYSMKILFILDITFMLMCMYACKKYNKKFLLCYLVIPVVWMIHTNKQEQFIKENTIEAYNSVEKKELMKSISEADNAFYRFDDFDYSAKTSNQIQDLSIYKTSLYSSNKNEYYANFYQNIMSMPGEQMSNANLTAVEQPFFQSLMSVKYIHTSRDRVPLGFSVIKKNQETKILKNSYALPLVYVSYHTMNESDFATREYPYTLETLMRNTIISNQSIDTDSELTMKPYEAKFNLIQKEEGIDITKIKNGYHFKVEKKGNIVIKLEKPIKDEILILDLPIRNIKNEETSVVSININGIQNKIGASGDIYSNHKENLRYVLSADKTWDTLTLTIQNAEFDILDSKGYVMKEDVFKDRVESVTAMEIDKFTDNAIIGTIHAKSEGYVTTSIPYQDGFQCFIDDKKVEYEKVNEAFIGFPIEKGTHKILLEYHMPGKNLGILISVVCLILSLILYKIQKKKSR